MRAVWSTVVTPILSASDPKTILELGSGDEEFSEMLEGAATEQGAAVIRAAELESVDLAGSELTLVYGEPNWYSVTERLERVAALAARGDAPLPITLVHEVDWPTGRRDAYPDPSSIPVGARQAHRPDRGIERAIDEHDHRNGVMTAVEDFVGSSAEELELIHVPGLGGTAIIVPARRLRGKGSLAIAQVIEGLRQSPEMLAHLAAIEADRINAVGQVEALSFELDAAQSGLSLQSSSELEQMRERLEEHAAIQAELREAIARRDARLEVLTTSRSAPPAPKPAAPAQDTSEELGGPAKPLPLDRHGILRAEDQRGSADELPPINVFVRATGDVEQLRLCLWSILDRAGRPLRLTLGVDDDADAAIRELANAVVEAEPRVVIVEDPPPRRRPEEWALVIHRPVKFFHRTVSNLIRSASGPDGPRPTAAVSADAIGVPAWAGADCLPLLLAGQTRDIAAAGDVASDCVVVPPGADSLEPEAVALDAPVGDGATAQPLPGLDWLDGAFADERRLIGEIRARLEGPSAVAYVLPGLPAEGSGGSHSVFQEAQGLRSIGARVRVLIESEFSERAAGLYPEASELIYPYDSPRAFSGGLAGFDVLVATEAPSALLVDEHIRAHDGVLGAYYVQDYEPLFAPAGGPSADAALLSYRQAKGLLLFAKTHWIGNVVSAAHHIPVAKVSPSLDQAIFHAEGRRTEIAPVRILAMVRPRTPRRRPAETRAALARLKRELGDGVECLSFGCTTAELESLPPVVGVEHLGSLTRSDVAEVLRRCDVFLDLSSYQAFGRTGLEGMACGAVPLLPDVGGVTEYAVDGHNALLVDTSDEDAVVGAVTSLFGNPDLLARLRAAGIESAKAFTVIRAATSQYACFTARREQGEGLDA